MRRPERIELKRLEEIDPADIIALMNRPEIRRHMPLAGETFTEADCAGFVAGKAQLWDEHGYGPWGFVVDGRFVGWGGLQPEEGDADLALVLHPDHWGVGRYLYEEIIARAFGPMEMPSVTILFPPSRTRIGAIVRLGFQPDGEVEIAGERFLRYRLQRGVAPESGA